jgi:hypothetical protein
MQKRNVIAFSTERSIPDGMQGGIITSPRPPTSPALRASSPKERRKGKRFMEGEMGWRGIFRRLKPPVNKVLSLRDLLPRCRFFYHGKFH